MYVQMFLTSVGFIVLLGYFFIYKKQYKIFFTTITLYILVIAFYILSSPHRINRLISWFDSLFS